MHLPLNISRNSEFLKKNTITISYQKGYFFILQIPDNNENVNSTTEATAASQDRLPETAERENLEMGRREQDYVLPNRPSVSSSLEVACSNGQSNGRNDVGIFQ